MRPSNGEHGRIGQTGLSLPDQIGAKATAG
jgi:hypothetical protein